MQKAMILAAAVSLLAVGTTGFAEGKKNGFAETTTSYLGNSGNEADPGQGGHGTRDEETSGPKGQVVNQDDSDCHNCSTDTTNRPGESK